jgi:hypothetical protein
MKKSFTFRPLEVFQMKTIVASAISAFLLMALSVSPLHAEETFGPLDVDSGLAGANAYGINAACSTGWTDWDKCQHTWQGGGTTYCFLKTKQFWVRAFNNDVAENLLIACAGSNTKIGGQYSHYCQFYVTSCASGYGDWSAGRIWEY